MTRYLLDVASYQGALKIEDVIRAGFTAVNLKTSHGMGSAAVHPDVAGWAVRARAGGLGISTFHYLTGDASGEDQATHAHAWLAELGLLTGTAHQVDCESDATEAILREYVITMQDLLERPIAIYSADWWWMPRGWTGADLTPYLWAAPNPGYPGKYPGDFSPLWVAGYGGWAELSVMQYAVAPLTFPDGTIGTIKVSKSAVRSDAVWTALTGGNVANWQLTTGLQTLRAQVNERWPNRDKSSDGTIGDAAHIAETSGHNPDDTAGSKAEFNDRDGKAEVRAWDLDVDFRESGTTAQMLVDHLRKLPGLGSVIRYMIYDRREYHVDRGFVPVPYTGPSAHTEHVHFSGARTQAADGNTTYDYQLWEVNMPSAQEIAEAVAVRLRIGDKGVMDKLGGDLNGDPSGVAIGVRRQVDNVVAAEFAAIKQALEALPDTLLARLGGATVPPATASPEAALTQAQVEDAVRAVLRAGVGPA